MNDHKMWKKPDMKFFKITQILVSLWFFWMLPHLNKYFSLILTTPFICKIDEKIVKSENQK